LAVAGTGAAGLRRGRIRVRIPFLPRHVLRDIAVSIYDLVDTSISWINILWSVQPHTEDGTHGQLCALLPYIVITSVLKFLLKTMAPARALSLVSWGLCSNCCPKCDNALY
jgi:hypothetical protein